MSAEQTVTRVNKTVIILVVAIPVAVIQVTDKVVKIAMVSIFAIINTPFFLHAILKFKVYKAYREVNLESFGCCGYKRFLFSFFSTAWARQLGISPFFSDPGNLSFS